MKTYTSSLLRVSVSDCVLTWVEKLLKEGEVRDETENKMDVTILWRIVYLFYNFMVFWMNRRKKKMLLCINLKTFGLFLWYQYDPYRKSQQIPVSERNNKSESVVLHIKTILYTEYLHGTDGKPKVSNSNCNCATQVNSQGNKQLARNTDVERQHRDFFLLFCVSACAEWNAGWS